MERVELLEIFQAPEIIKVTVFNNKLNNYKIKYYLFFIHLNKTFVDFIPALYTTNIPELVRMFMKHAFFYLHYEINTPKEHIF